MTAPLLTIEGLGVELPDGRPLLQDLDLTVHPGEVVAILGGSGAGKSTLARALFEPELLARMGFRTHARVAELAHAALVPQRGAPFDHLDVRGNVRLALRWRKGPVSPDPLPWLKQVGLPESVQKKGVATGGLSGGQAQRLAVARALAGGRDLLFLDEPSAGLDPKSAQDLAHLLRQRADEGAGVVIVTHDTLLAAECADRLLVLDADARKLVPLEVDPSDRTALEAELREVLSRPPPERDDMGRRRLRPGAWLADRWVRTFGGLETPGLALLGLLSVRLRQLPDLARVFGRALRQGFFRPAAFYAAVATLLGFTVLYVLVRAAPAGVDPVRLLQLVGGSYVLALGPPLSALLFVATSGSAVNAWLGTLVLGKQLTALRALGVEPRSYLWLPVFTGLTASFLLAAALITAGMLAGGGVIYAMEGVELPRIVELLLGDVLDPVPERATLRTRALWLFLVYAPGIAADVVRRGTDLKKNADDVTRAMTGSVVACTLWVVALELVSALVLFSTRVDP